MKKFLHLFTTVLSLGTLAMTAKAATVVWNPATAISDAAIITPGAGQQLFAAYAFGSSSSTLAVDGVTFNIVNPGSLGSAPFTLTNAILASGVGGVNNPSSPWAGLSTNLQSLMSTLVYGNSASQVSPQMVLTLTGLTVGQTYSASFFVSQIQANGKYDVITSGGQASSNAYFNWNYAEPPVGQGTNPSDGVGTVVTATFTADSTTQEFDLSQNWAGALGYPDLNAIEVMAVPEPSTVALMSSVIGLFALVSIRRLRQAAA